MDALARRVPGGAQRLVSSPSTSSAACCAGVGAARAASGRGAVPEGRAGAPAHLRERRRRSLACGAESTQQQVARDVFPLDVSDDEEKRRVRHKTHVLMDILTAGERVEAVIEANTGEIDEEMLDLLERRTRRAASMGEPEATLRGLALLKRRLRVELERRNATPTQKLLDALLELLAPEPGVHPAEQEEEVERVLRWAFQPPPVPHVDIFGTAARIAAGEEVELPAAESEGHIPQHVFLWEAEQLLTAAGRNARDLARRLQRGNLGQYEAAYRHTLTARQEALQRLGTVLSVAKRI